MKRLGIWIAAGLLFGCSGGSGSEGGEGGGSDKGGSAGKASGGAGGKAAGGTGGKATTGGTSGTATGGTSGTATGGTSGTATGGTAAGGTGGSKAGGTGGTAATGGTGGTAVTGCTELTGTVRDFVSSHADFQFPATAAPALSAPGMVKTALENGKPKLSTTGEFKDANGFVQSVSSASFDEWWNDSASKKGLVRKFMVEKRTLQLNAFGSEMFFPIDGDGLGNTDYVGTDTPATDLEKTDDDAHNQLFTVEINAEFLYEKGKSQIFISESDDDSWVFINGKLAIDSGGLHGFAPASASLDPIANELGLESGKSYPIAMFFADRQLSGAKYRVSTNATFTKCPK